MSKQISFYRKSRADYDFPLVTYSSSYSSATLKNMFDRRNTSAWGPTGGSDATEPKFEIDFGDNVTIDTLILVKHNWKSFLLERWTGSAWQAVIFPSGITAETGEFDLKSILFPTGVSTTKLRVTIYSTQVANELKYCFQFIPCRKIGTFNAWPIISKPLLSKNLKTVPMLSGKSSVVRNSGRYSATLGVSVLRDDADLTLIESLFDSTEGFLYWPSSGDESQFSSVRQGYQAEDIYLVRCTNEYSPEFHKGLYKSGLKVQMDLIEVTN